MVADLNGIIIDQIYGDNSGGAEFDTDGDGTATQEDEFVSIQNTTAAPMDVSGWQIWSDMTGAGAPDSPQDGLYHTFPPGTVIAPGESLIIVNEISGTPTDNMQEASEGGIESGAGGTNTNFLSEGSSGAFDSEGVALVDPSTGDYIAVDLAASDPSDFESMSGFPGTNLVASSNAATDSGQEDMGAGSSYQYNATTDSYEYAAVVLCFAAGTLISVPGGARPVEDLRTGDLVITLDHGAQPLRRILRRRLKFLPGAGARHKPIELKPGAVASGVPDRRLLVSPQHRILVRHATGREDMMPAKDLTRRRGVRVMAGCRAVTYVHLVFARHEIVRANGCWCESFYPGPYAMSAMGRRARAELMHLFPDWHAAKPAAPARPLSRGR